jgi:hypothetical protein
VDTLDSRYGKQLATSYFTVINDIVFVTIDS